MIFDCFTFFNELELLDIRLHELSGVVDRFVLVEATHSFQNKPKPLHFDANRSLFKPYLDKIIHVRIEFPPDVTDSNKDAWSRERYQRNAISLGLTGAAPEDLIMVSDVDEIVSAEGLSRGLSLRRKRQLTVFTLRNMIFFLDRYNPRKVWYLGPRLIERGMFRTPEQLKTTRLFASHKLKGTWIGGAHTRLRNLTHSGIGAQILEIPEAGWHFSWIGGLEKFREKIYAFSHTEMAHLDAGAAEEIFIAKQSGPHEYLGQGALPSYVRADLKRFGAFIEAKEQI